MARVVPQARAVHRVKPVPRVRVARAVLRVQQALGQAALREQVVHRVRVAQAVQRGRRVGQDSVVHQAQAVLQVRAGQVVPLELQARQV